MGSNVVASLNPVLQATQTPGVGVLINKAVSIPEALAIVLANGTAADQVNLCGFGTYNFTASTPQTINLQALTDFAGATTLFLRIRLAIFKLYNCTTDGATLTLGNAGSNPWTGFLSSTGTYTMYAATATNPNGSFWIATAPNTTAAVVGSTSKNILATPSANAMTLDIIAFGADA